MKTNIGILVNMTGMNIPHDVRDVQANAMTALAAAILRGCPPGWSIEADPEYGVITVMTNGSQSDPRDPRPEIEMIGKHPIFRYHNCARCDSGREPCIQSNPRQCDWLHARND
jgi:hypothetical protein